MSGTKNVNSDAPKMALEITPISHPLHASVCVPGSKSLTNRALLVASLARGTTVLTNALFSDDSLYFVKALTKLGFSIFVDPACSTMSITGFGGMIPEKSAELYIGNAGTAARFLTAFLTLGNGEYILDGDSRMRERPIAGLVSALGQLGASIVPLSPSMDDSLSISLPIKITASGLLGGHTQVGGNISSQFLSGLLMVAPYARTRTEVVVTTELNSKPYVDLTLAIMSDFGVEITRQGYEQFDLIPASYRPKQSYTIESDASAASYFFAAPAISGGSVRVINITRRSIQGDIAFLEILEQMGCTVVDGKDYVEVTGPTALRGVDVDMRDISDTAQTLAAIAPFATSPTRIRGIGFIRAKESDRIADTCAELTRLGVDVQEHSDGMTIFPCAKINPSMVRTYNDHRMAMAFALIGLRVPGISIENSSCVSKTFPDYFQTLEILR
jgi:3-phosphoshikimate 1-carboxyvinyltransferase